MGRKHNARELSDVRDFLFLQCTGTRSTAKNVRFHFSVASRSVEGGS